MTVRCIKIRLDHATTSRAITIFFNANCTCTEGDPTALVLSTAHFLSTILTDSSSSPS